MTAQSVVVTGGAGFIGSNVADRLLHDGHRVVVYDSLVRPGTEANAEWLKARHRERVEFVVADIRDEAALRRVAPKAEAVFHFAAQVAVTTSMVDPRSDFEINIAGTLNVLEAMRRERRRIPIVFASTNKVYGDLSDVGLSLTSQGYLPEDARLRASGIGEARPLDFHTPYGCSKGAADQYVLDYARSFDLPSAVLRMSCIYGQRQMGTEDQGWVAHFIIRALRGEPITIFGDGHQVRDVLFIEDTVDAYMAIWKQIEAVKGRAFNLGGGPANAISLRSLIALIEERLGERVDTRFEDWRPGDQRYYVSDCTAIRETLGLAAPLGWKSGVERLIAWLQEQRSPSSAMPPVGMRQPETAL